MPGSQVYLLCFSAGSIIVSKHTCGVFLGNSHPDPRMKPPSFVDASMASRHLPSLRAFSVLSLGPISQIYSYLADIQRGLNKVIHAGKLSLLQNFRVRQKTHALASDKPNHVLLNYAVAVCLRFLGVRRDVRRNDYIVEFQERAVGT